jgi:hypothetical protein
MYLLLGIWICSIKGDPDTVDKEDKEVKEDTDDTEDKKD